ncbi:MAG: zinc-ribbon domain-containing protein [Clostridia bacterium]|nr:zinc-ribbon domain-containing protein [Clostridia bacterium]
MFCGNCGKQLEDGTKVCPNCGEVFVQEAAEAVQQAGEEAQNAVAEAGNEIANQAEEAEREARKIEEEAQAEIARQKAKAEEARAKAEAAKAAALAKAREEAQKKALSEATEAVNFANYKISQLAQANDVQKKAAEEAAAAHQKAQELIRSAEELGASGIPALAALPVAADTRSAAPAKAEKAAAPAPQVTAAGEPVKLVKPIGYILWGLLYCVPVIGWVFLIVHTFSKKNRNLKNFAISVWIRLLIILVIAAICVLLYVIFKENPWVKYFENSFKEIWTNYFKVLIKK